MALSNDLSRVLGDATMMEVGDGVSTPSSPGIGLLRIGAFKLQKVNGCLERAQVRPVVVIQKEVVADDLEYFNKHVLICKFLGMRVSFPFLEPWIQRTWNLEGDLEILLAANNFFLVDFLCISDINRAFEGGPYIYNQVGLFIKPWHVGFNSVEEFPSKVPVWVHLPWLPLECWRSDILQSISMALGKPIGPSQ